MNAATMAIFLCGVDFFPLGLCLFGRKAGDKSCKSRLIYEKTPN